MAASAVLKTLGINTPKQLSLSFDTACYQAYTELYSIS